MASRSVGSERTASDSVLSSDVHRGVALRGCKMQKNDIKFPSPSDDKGCVFGLFLIPFVLVRLAWRKVFHG